VDIYDIQQAVDDGATVPIYYENRQAKLILDETARLQLDEQFDEVTEDEEDDRRERLKRKWAALETLVGSKTRLEQIAQDLIQHFEERQKIVKGKGMIVCMSREICVRLYDILVRLRPAWHNEDPDKGGLKVIMTGTASDQEHLSRHAHSKAVKEHLAKRFKDPDNLLELVIVRDMWLTGFDAPCLHTLYVDKPMKGHNLMQAIARVNRVFRDKPGGLVVDYLGFAGELRQALRTYKRSGGRGRSTIDIEKALEILQEKLEVCRALFHGFDYTCYATDALQLLRPAMDHILGLEEGKKRFMDVVIALTKGLGLCGTHEEALAVREEIAFFQAVKAALIKHTAINSPSCVGGDSALRQIVENSIVCEGVINILDQDGAKKSDLAVLSEAFLDEVHTMPEKNLAAALLERLLRDQIQSHTCQNLMQSQKFLKLLEQSLNKYQNRSIETTQLIEELIQMAKEMKAAINRGEDLALSSDELAFYDALEANDSAVQVLGDDKLKLIAQELTAKVRENISIDWTKRESVRARLRTLIRRILRRYGYPPDRAAQAIDTVIQQAEVLSKQWVTDWSFMSTK
jgi:type I restriction enzyme R subunit